MRVTIHQPEFLPWLGFVDKVSRADTLVLLDDAQFRRGYFQNRNRIRTAQGWSWITVPVAHEGLATRIDEIRIASGTNPRWQEKILRSVEYAYRRAPFFDRYYPALQEILAGAGERLVDLNVALIRWLLGAFGLEPVVVRGSQLQVGTTGSERLLDLCRRLGATTYVSGISGREYLDTKRFMAAGIRVEFQEFHHPVYAQLHAGFEPLMSGLDALFLFGPGCVKLLVPSWPKRLVEVFH